MDENNMNGFGNTDDDDEFGGTTVLSMPGVNAFSDAQQDGNVNSGQFQQPGSQGQPNPQGQYGGFGQFQQPEPQGQPNPQGQYGGFGQFQQPEPQGQPNPQGQYGGFGQFQQPGPQGQPNPQGQYGDFNQFQQPYGQPGQPFGVPQGADMQPGKKFNKKMAAIIGGIVAALIIVAVVLVILLGGRNSAAKVGDKLAKAYEKGDADAVVDLMNEDYYETYNMVYEYYGSDSYIEDRFNEDVQDMKDAVGKVKSIKIEDRDEEKYDEDDIDDANDTLQTLKVDMKVDECSEIDLDVKIKGSDGDTDGSIVYTVVKSGGKWYLVDFDLYVY